MNRKSFLTTALLSFAALLMPRKAQALTEEPAPEVKHEPLVFGVPDTENRRKVRAEWNAWIASDEVVSMATGFVFVGDRAVPSSLNCVHVKVPPREELEVMPSPRPSPS